MAKATNTGLSTMQDCVPTVTAEMIRNMTNAYIREETIKLANAKIINQRSELTLSKEHGKGELSSSDVQRFIMRANSLLS